VGSTSLSCSVLDESKLTAEMAWQDTQRIRPPACSRPTGMDAPQAGQGTRPGLPCEVNATRAVAAEEAASAVSAARISRAIAVQLSKRWSGSLESPRSTASDSRRGMPGITSSSAGGTTIVWLTTVAEGVGPSMQLRPQSTSCTVIASAYWSTRPSNGRPMTISGAT
jgi:hypothetical protein